MPIQPIMTENGRETLHKTSLLLQAMPPEHITNEQLDNHEKGKIRVLVYREPNSRMSMSVPLGNCIFDMSSGDLMYNVWFDKIVTPKYSVPKHRSGDLLDILVSNIRYELDSKFMLTIRRAAEESNDGKREFRCEHDVCRNCLFEALHKGFWHPSTAVVSENFLNKVTRFSRNESNDGIHEHAGVKFFVTDRVQDNELISLVKQPFLGKCYVLEDFTVYESEKKVFAYMTIGATIGNVDCVGRSLWLSPKVPLDSAV